jgi:hypothetical protein
MISIIQREGIYQKMYHKIEIYFIDNDGSRQTGISSINPRTPIN